MFNPSIIKVDEIIIFYNNFINKYLPISQTVINYFYQSTIPLQTTGYQIRGIAKQRDLRFSRQLLAAGKVGKKARKKTAMITVNAMGDNCPIPVIKTKKAMQALTGPDTIEVLVDNEIAVQNVSKMASAQGGQVNAEKLGEKEYKVTIRMQGAPDGSGSAEENAGAVCRPDQRGDAIVVVSSDRMGSGNDELGKVLIKGFIFAVTQLDVLPRKMLFYNGGATLTTEGSDSLEDLKSLEAQGVEILTCGTCLDYYQLKDKLAVGTVTNMYSIVEAMAETGKIIRP